MGGGGGSSSEYGNSANLHCNALEEERRWASPSLPQIKAANRFIHPSRLHRAHPVRTCSSRLLPPKTAQRQSSSTGKGSREHYTGTMNKLMALCLGALALAFLLPVEIYCQNSTTQAQNTTNVTTTSSASGAAVTTSMGQNTTTTKNYGNVLHVPSSLFFVAVSASLLHLC